ncbi:MAG: ABC transporter permease [Sphingobacteriia bacterium]|nr:ABC transporter permease [Sphingobacteriia bacterium]
MKNQVLFENIKISVEAIRSHLLRSILTILIIAFGIMALVGISTAIDALEKSLAENLMMMGSNTFSIRNRTMRVQVGNNVKRSKHYEPIKFRQGMDFKEKFNYPAFVSVFTTATWNATVTYQSETTNPNIGVLGTDENYLITSGLELERGRSFGRQEVYFGNSVAIIGAEIAKNLFKNNEDPIDKHITVGSGKYRVIGVIKEKGTGMGFTPDRQVLIPITNARHYFSRPNMSYTINVLPEDMMDIDDAMGEAAGLFRIIRQNKLYEEDDFDISKSDQLLQMLFENTRNIKGAALIIGFITLFGAAIGLMNIMLVSVTERTREIGIRKSIGAKRLAIRNQFLVEAIIIGQFGGVFGIILGILAGNIVTIFTKTSFVVPWLWIVFGALLCLIVALISGIVPALKAANLDPIESLRYE